MTNRRDFLKLAAMAGIVSQVGFELAEAKELKLYELPKLDYEYSALEPYIDAETMKIHHTKHHQAYIDGLVKAEQELTNSRSSGNYDLVQFWSNKLSFHGGGHFLHSMFWKIMCPANGQTPKGKLLKLINRDFGSFDIFKAQFSAAALQVEGSGWALLHYRVADSKLIILQAENQHRLTSWGIVPILGIDVWEHAYYLKYRNNRKEYISNWWNVVNWEAVADNLAAVD